MTSEEDVHMAVEAEDLLAELLMDRERVSPEDIASLKERHPSLEVGLDRAFSDYLAASAAIIEFRADGDASGGRSDWFKAGDCLGGFRLIHLLGSGGQALVWEAEQETVGRSVALKILTPGRVGPSAVARFEQEARAVASNPHPAIVAIYERGETDGIHWIAQELVPGGRSLFDLIEESRRRFRIDADHFDKAAHITARIADALELAHGIGVIHRDVKPQNILLMPDGQPKLADFGLARVQDIELTTTSGVALGTYVYMSPEQIGLTRDKLDERTDIFSLGLVLYELLTLQRAFDGDTSAQVAHKITHESPPSPRSIRSTCPRDLELICLKAIEKEPRHRYASAKAFADDLRRYIAGDPVLAAPPSLVRRARHWIRRHPVRTAVTASVLAAVAIIVPLVTAKVRDAASLARLSAIQDHAELIDLADRLWPPLPDRIEEYRRWIVDAERLAASLPSHRIELARLGERIAVQAGGAVRVDLAARLGGSDLVERWWYRQLEKLVASLEELADEDRGLLGDSFSRGHGWSVRRRLQFAASLVRRYAPGGDLDQRWAAFLPAMRGEFPAMRVHMELVPLGRNAETNLWEFWHVASGTEPQLVDGTWRPQLGGGLVLVLLPGGTSQMGSQLDAPTEPYFVAGARPNEQPLHAVTLSPFLISKYEVTQGQWERLAGWNPSYIFPGAPDWPGGTMLHPVENISWFDGVRVSGWFGMTLPTEAQWEFACRAGGGSAWWTGDTVEGFFSSRGGNVADREMAEWEEGLLLSASEFSDGYPCHAPIGSFAPNPFGLFDVHGNVGEFCLDGYDMGFYGTSLASRANPVNPDGNRTMSVRGGAFQFPIITCRSAYRGNALPSSTGWNVGVRPVLVFEEL